MYEFAPKADKRREKLWLIGSLGLAALFFIGSYLPAMPLPSVLQLIAFACFSFAIIVASKYLLCTYVYRIELIEGGERELVVIEHCARRIRTVCRLPLSSVRSVQEVTAQNRKRFLTDHRQRMIYRYTGEMQSVRAIGLEASYGGEEFCLLLLYDEGLKRVIELN